MLCKIFGSRSRKLIILAMKSTAKLKALLQSKGITSVVMELMS